MLNSVTFNCTALKGTNKVGLIKPDEQGYYPVILGALNAYNSVGDLYAYEGSKDLFESSSSFMRRVKRGALRSENGHPKMQAGQSIEQYAQRLMEIHENRVCAHIKSVRLVFDKIKDERGRPIIAIEGMVTPAGELGYVLENALKNPNENIAFSLRAFTEDTPTFRGTRKILRNLITFDYVGEPGIAQAEKYYSPSLEELQSTSFNRVTLEDAYYGKSSQGVPQSSLESMRFTADELFTSLGWFSNSERPSYLDW